MQQIFFVHDRAGEGVFQFVSFDKHESIWLHIQSVCWRMQSVCWHMQRGYH